MPNPNTGDVNPALEPAEAQSQDKLAHPDTAEHTKQKIPVGDVGSNKETEGGRENQEQTRKTHSSKNNDVGDDTTAKK